jgi:hypothetical protein
LQLPFTVFRTQHCGVSVHHGFSEVLLERWMGIRVELLDHGLRDGGERPEVKTGGKRLDFGIYPATG